MTDVAVIGFGLHRFGRFEGKSAMQMGADGIRLGDYDIGIVIGLDKHPRGAFTEDPALVGMPRWYAENGQYLTTQFFGMKANRYLHDHGISHQTPARVAAKNFRNGALNPNALRRKLISEKDILASPMLNYPLTQYMFCAPDEGAYEVNTTFAPIDEDLAPTVYAARAAFEKAGVAPTALDVIQLQDTDAGAEIIHMAECGFCAPGEQEKLLDDGVTEIAGSMPVNTDGGLIANGEPIGASGLRQVHQVVRQLRAEAGDLMGSLGLRCVRRLAQAEHVLRDHVAEVCSARSGPLPSGRYCGPTDMPPTRRRGACVRRDPAGSPCPRPCPGPWP